ncbi:hypothetical protein V2J09_016742 [Rumex salicifolius]
MWNSKCRLDKLDNSVDGDDDSELICFCGYPAQLRRSTTSKFLSPINTILPFDPKRHTTEMDFFRDECMNLQKKLDDEKLQRQQERNGWNTEKDELKSQLSASELG